MLAVIYNPAHFDLFTLELRAPGQKPELLFFRHEANLLAMFPEAVWAGRATPAQQGATYTRSRHSAHDIGAMGDRVFENAYPETA